MKKIIYLALGATALFASCKKDKFSSEKPLIPAVGAGDPDTLTGNIGTLTLTKPVYYIKGFTWLDSLATLTIPAGTKLIGSPGGAVVDQVDLSNNKGTLVIRRGAKIIANGTPTNPIIWTSSKPVGTRAYGDWGGLVIEGEAKLHTITGGSNLFYEAFDFNPSDTRNISGGNNDADNSGSLTYNRFEFGGGVIYTANKEVNGLTLCGVGSGTTINHIIVNAAGDDSYEFFGGAVNADHLLAFNGRDDQFDFDNGYTGKLQYIIGYNAGQADNSGSELIESDNDGSATNFAPFTNAFIANATLIGPSTASNFTGTNSLYYNGGSHIRRNTRLTLVNSLFIGQKHPSLFATTPSTLNRIANAPSLSDSIVIAYNLVQLDTLGKAAITNTAEGSPIPLNLLNNAFMVGRIGSAANANGVLNTFADFKLDGSLKPLPGSPALSGGANLAALGLPFFTGTTQRGGVVTTDVWTVSPWVAIPSN